MTLYDKIGQGYSRSRAPDFRIVEGLLGALAVPVGSTILDVGAGYGKYANALADRGYHVIALEPSSVMRAQANPHENVHWVSACAENIPLLPSSVDAAFMILVLHHLKDRKIALSEIRRVVGNGPIVVFTFEPSRLQKFWLAEYFPRLG